MGNQSFETNDNQIIQTIQDAVATSVIKVAPDEFLTREVFLPPKKPLVAAIACASLTGLIDYLKYGIDAQARESIAVHVVSPTRVEVINQIENAEDRRFTSFVTEADVPKISLLGNYMSQEAAMIELQSKFVQAADSDIHDVYSIVGNIVADEELAQEDDGITQRVAVQAGINRGFADIKNPVSLTPFRTFTEIDQPASPFVLRLTKTNGIQVALFEADGGQWRNTARQSIKGYLADELGSDVTILA